MTNDKEIMRNTFGDIMVITFYNISIKCHFSWVIADPTELDKHLETLEAMEHIEIVAYGPATVK